MTRSPARKTQQPALDGMISDDAVAVPAKPRGITRRGRTRHGTQDAQFDLFPAAAASDASANVAAEATSTPDTENTTTKAPPIAQPSGPAPLPPSLSQSRNRESVRFLPAPVSLRQFAASAQPDAADVWLYVCCDDETEARALVEDGLSPDRDAPPALREAGAALAWLAERQENAETGAMDAPALLRLRRAVMERAIEIDPDGSRTEGLRVWLLTGDRDDD
ncbi:hypothetical protein [Acetobacter sp. DsW_063]|uniref:hypothetical protein n=1 Tax=Acetobacter sp. DsW_063 TaxID=1514894 RepID=UPI0011778B95|nr:hypothetical protein [Acetobacter sp. DsW_063]